MGDQRAQVVTNANVFQHWPAFVTGVTEPLEFSFMFVAYPLYVIHALLTGTSLALVNALGIHDGFGFSAGAIDFLLNFRIAQQPVLLLLIGLAYGVLYYFLFRFVIVKFDLHTPGREVDGETTDLNNVLVDQADDEVAQPVTPPDRSPGSATSERPASAPVG